MPGLKEMSSQQAYDTGYRDGESSLAADISFQFDEAQSMDELLGFFRRLTSTPDLEWPGVARAE